MNPEKTSTIFLQVVIVLIGIGALAVMLWEPHLEGRNVGATVYQIYFNDPFLAYAYTASIPFFMALYQAFNALRYVRQNKTVSQATVKALRTIKYCAITMIGFAAGAEIFILLNSEEDKVGGIFIGIVIAFASIVVATSAGIFKKNLQDALDMKSKKDLAV